MSGTSDDTLWAAYDAATLISDRMEHFEREALVPVTGTIALNLLDAAEQVVHWDEKAARRRVRTITAEPPSLALGRLRNLTEQARAAAASDPSP